MSPASQTPVRSESPAPPGDAFVMPTYARYPLTIVRGEGMYLVDDAGREYLDFAGALGAMPLGHAHPAWRAAVHAQTDTLALTSNLFATEPQATLAARLAGLVSIPDARTFLCNSGAEANEAALKIVRRRGLERGRTRIVALDGSFHGRTIATLAATGQPSKRAPFEPLLDWFQHVPATAGAMQDAVGPATAAVMIEPVLGEGGVRPLDHDFLRLVRALCSERGALLVADEVQSGLGRCGEWLAVSAADVIPDVVTLAKGLGGGLPIGACIAPADLALGPGQHGSTFGGGPIPCAASLAVLETIDRDDLLANARAQGVRLRSALGEAVGDLVVDVRGAGLLAGVQLSAPVAHDVVLEMIGRGVLATEAGVDVVRFSPPLVATEEHVDLAAAAFGEAVMAVVGAKEVAS